MHYHQDDDLRTKENGKKLLKVKHTDNQDALFKLLPGNAKLEYPGPLGQYFSQPGHSQHSQKTVMEENPEDDPE